jgi:hypothetical protein
MKLRNLNPSALQASKQDDLGITLFLNKDTGTVCYKNTDGTIVEVGEDTAALTANTANIAANTGLYTEVTIPPGVAATSGILGMGSVSVTLISAPGAGKSIVVKRMTIEYIAGATGYSFASGDLISLRNTNGDILAGIDNLIFGTANKTVTVYPTGAVTYNSFEAMIQSAETLNGAITLDTWGGENPINGDGSLRVKLWYEIETFGSRL